MSGPTLSIEAEALTLTLGDEEPLVLTLTGAPLVLSLDATISLQGPPGSSGIGELVALTEDTEIGTETGTAYTNEGAAGVVVATLPETSELVDGERFLASFYVVEAQTLRVQAQGTDVIRYSGVATAAAGYLEIADVDAVLTLERVAAGVYLVTQAIREWSFGP
jgi:hypothetical protein